MAQTIKIKRSSSAATPSSALSAGELAYSFNSNKLFIGDGSNNDIIGGQLYTNMLDHTAGTLTASSALIVDSNSKIDNLLVDNLQLNGNTISSTSGNIVLTSATGSVSLASAATEFLITDNSATAFTISESTNNYLTFDTTNSAEKIIFNQKVDLNAKELIFDADADTSISASIDDLLVFKSGGTSWLLASANVGLSPNVATPLGNSTTPWSELHVDNIKVDGNAITSVNSNGDLTITPNGTGSVVIDGLSHPQADGSAGQFLKTDGSGNLSFGTVTSSLTLAADSGSNDTFNTGQTLTFSGGEGIDTTVSDNTITIAGELATTSNKGVASFDSTDFSVSSGAVSINAITLGSSSLNPGATTTDIAGLTSLVIDNININGNVISTTDSNGNLSLNPNGSGQVDVNSSRIVNVTDPTGTQDAATKGYVDAVKQALDIKDSVHLASTANVALTAGSSGLEAGDSIDGVTLVAGDRVLLKNQTDASENGIYVAVASGGTPARSTDANTSSEVTSGMFCFVEEGTANGDNGFVLTTNDSITLDTTDLTFVQFSGAGQVIAGDALSKSGNTLNVNDDNITLEVSSDSLRIKGITATAVGDIILGAASNTGYTRHVKPSSTATTNSYLLSMDTNGNAVWGDVLDGGTFS